MCKLRDPPPSEPESDLDGPTEEDLAEYCADLAARVQAGGEHGEAQRVQVLGQLVPDARVAARNQDGLFLKTRRGFIQAEGGLE